MLLLDAGVRHSAYLITVMGYLLSGASGGAYTTAGSAKMLLIRQCHLVALNENIDLWRRSSAKGSERAHEVCEVCMKALATLESHQTLKLTQPGLMLKGMFTLCMYIMTEGCELRISMYECLATLNCYLGTDLGAVPTL